MRRMTVWKSCHGVCNLEACFFGGDLHGWWKLRALPTKTGILTCRILLIRNPAGVRYDSWPLLPTPSKKRGRSMQLARPSP